MVVDDTWCAEQGYADRVDYRWLCHIVQLDRHHRVRGNDRCTARTPTGWSWRLPGGKIAKVYEWMRSRPAVVDEAATSSAADDDRRFWRQEWRRLAMAGRLACKQYQWIRPRHTWRRWRAGRGRKSPKGRWTWFFRLDAWSRRILTSPTSVSESANVDRCSNMSESWTKNLSLMGSVR